MTEGAPGPSPLGTGEGNLLECRLPPIPPLQIISPSCATIVMRGKNHPPPNAHLPERRKYPLPPPVFLQYVLFFFAPRRSLQAQASSSPASSPAKNLRCALVCAPAAATSARRAHRAGRLRRVADRRRPARDQPPQRPATLRANLQRTIRHLLSCFKLVFAGFAAIVIRRHRQYSSISFHPHSTRPRNLPRRRFNPPLTISPPSCTIGEQSLPLSAEGHPCRRAALPGQDPAAVS